jgi:hypothetical protein
MLAAKASDLANSFQRLFITDMATQRIGRIGGINNDPTVGNRLRRPHQQPSLGVGRVNGKVPTHVLVDLRGFSDCQTKSGYQGQPVSFTITRFAPSMVRSGPPGVLIKPE